MSELPDIPSPCIGVCQLDPASRMCTGCLRTSREIARWPFAENTERMEILGELKARRRDRGQTSAADLRPRRRRNANSDPS